MINPSFFLVDAATDRTKCYASVLRSSVENGEKPDPENVNRLLISEAEVCPFDSTFTSWLFPSISL